MSQKINKFKRRVGVISIDSPSSLLSETSTPKQWERCPILLERVRAVLRAAAGNWVTIHDVELFSPREGQYLARMLHPADGTSPSAYVRLEEAFGYRLETITHLRYPGLFVLQMEVPREFT